MRVTAAPDVAARPDAWTLPQRSIVGIAVVVGVLARWVDLGGTPLTFDESFTGTAAQSSPSELFRFLSTSDSHPPLDYLMRHLFAGTGSEFWVRFPSAVIGTITVLVVARWMWERGWFGVVVIGLTSVAAIQVLYARQARMYALVILAGTLMAVAAEQWLVAPRTRWATLAAGALLVGLFSHSSMVFAALGVMLVPGLRSDRDAWVWRAAVAGSVVVWALLWGPTLLDQLGEQTATWIPYTTPRTAIDAVAGQVSLYDGLAVLVVVAVLVGGIVLVRRHGALGRVWLCLFVAPALAEMIVGLRQHLLLPRSLAFAAWAVVLALAAVVAGCLEDRPAWLPGSVAAVAATLVLLLAVPSLSPAVSYEEASAPSRTRLGELVEPGDSVAVYPSFLEPMLRWDHDLPAAPAAPGLDGDPAWSGVVPGRAPTGRLWTLVPDTFSYRPPAAFVPCEDVASSQAGDLRLSCYQTTG